MSNYGSAGELYFGPNHLRRSVLTCFAAALRSEDRIDEAIAYCERALAIQRMVGNRQQEGIALGMLGQLMAKRGHLAEARAALASGEALLREIGAAPAHVGLLCDWADAEAHAGDTAEAGAKLDLAAAALREAGLPPDSEISRRVDAARAALLP